VIHRLAREGIKTVYVETANDRTSASLDFAHAKGLAGFVDAAHAKHIKIVAWYLPGLADYKLDLRRSLAAARLRTAAGNTIDSFALDFESSYPASISARNAATLKLTRAVRRHIGKGYSFGAIVPDSRCTTLATGLWPGFPFRSLRRYYDVFLPMAYSSYRAHGSSDVYAYTKLNVKLIRSRTGDRKVPVHVVGGLIGRVDDIDARAVVRGANRSGALGASFYGFYGSGPGIWAALRHVH
jgi:hypothetical protein